MNRKAKQPTKFPKKGIQFKDITPLLNDASAFRVAVQAMCEPFRDQRPQMLAAVESRGFPFGAAMALELVSEAEFDAWVRPERMVSPAPPLTVRTERLPPSISAEAEA